MLRGRTPVAFGNVDVPGWRSTTSTRAPARVAATAVASPDGPAPTTRTSYDVVVVV